LRGEFVRQIVRPKSCDRGCAAPWATAPMAAIALGKAMSTEFMPPSILQESQ
jgi:hypothetical protein